MTSRKLFWMMNRGRTSNAKEPTSSKLCMPPMQMLASFGIRFFPPLKASGKISVCTHLRFAFNGRLLIMTEDLAGWNWNQVVSPAETATNFLENAPSGYGLGLRDALSALGLPNTQSDDPNNGIKIIFVVHGDHDRAELEPYDPRYLPFDEQTYNAGRTYRSTGAFYKFGMETGTGAIFGLDRLAPVKAGEECNPPVTGADLPSLQRYSDVAWLFWAKTASTKNRLKYFITVAITNSETHQAIRRALKNARAEYGPWPGTTFPIDSDEGKVLLGT